MTLTERARAHREKEKLILENLAQDLTKWLLRPKTEKFVISQKDLTLLLSNIIVEE